MRLQDLQEARTLHRDYAGWAYKEMNSNHSYKESILPLKDNEVEPAINNLIKAFGEPGRLHDLSGGGHLVWNNYPEDSTSFDVVLFYRHGPKDPPYILVRKYRKQKLPDYA